MKTRTLLLIACCAGIIAFASHSLSAKSIRFIEPVSELVSVDIIGDERGRLPRELSRSGEDSFVTARRGERFSICVTNHSQGRVALAVSVDGRNIISGEKSYNRPGESMYVLAPGQRGDFEGWRSSYQKVQRFYFTDEEDSYSGRRGDYSQTGWIKVAVFRERQYFPSPRYLQEDMAASPQYKRSMESQAGTGYGEGSYSPVSTTSFEPENFAAQLVNIRYDWPEPKYRPEYYKTPIPGNFAQPPE